MSARRRERTHGTGSSNRQAESTRKPLATDTHYRFKAFLPRDHGLEKEDTKRLTATWGQNLVPLMKHSKSEHRESFLHDEVEHASTTAFQQTVENKKQFEVGSKRVMLVKARDKLNELAAHKYGSVKEMFLDFDDDKSGQVSLQEFSTTVKKRGLELLFPRFQQRLIFEHLDKDGSDKIDINELRTFLEKPVEGKKPFAGPDEVVATIPMTKKVRKVRDRLIENIFAKRRAAKLPDGKDYATAHLITTFKQIDEDMSGQLTRKEMTNALGPRHLNLGLSPEETNELIDHIDQNDDGHISYKEFIKFLEVHDIDPDYNPFYDARQVQLAKLDSIAYGEWEVRIPCIMCHNLKESVVGVLF